jgi:hypothetical protein
MLARLESRDAQAEGLADLEAGGAPCEGETQTVLTVRDGRLRPRGPGADARRMAGVVGSSDGARGEGGKRMPQGRGADRKRGTERRAAPNQYRGASD